MSAVPIPDHIRIVSEVLTALSGDLERVGTSVCIDAAFANKHMVALQAIDLIAQTQRSLAEILAAEQPQLAIEQLQLDTLRARFLA